jgi:putative cell wall-binding protein
MELYRKGMAKKMVAVVVVACVVALMVPVAAMGVTPKAFTGIVTDAVTGEPIEGAVVEAWDFEDFDSEYVAVTNAAGVYELYCPPGTYFLYAEATGYAWDYYEDAVYTSGAATQIDFALEPLKLAFFGIVTDSGSNAPIEGAEIDAFLLEDNDEYWVGYGVSDDQGEYGVWLAEEDAGDFILSAWAPGYGFDMAETSWNAGGPVRVDFALDPRPLVEIEGTNRYETAVMASQEAFPFGLDEDGALTVVIATGRNWPDALGGTALAGVLEAPILLVERNKIPEVVADEIERLGAENAIVLGGEAAVSSGVFKALGNLLDGDVDRIAGADRYITAEKIAKEVIALQGDWYDGKAFVATGRNFPDAIAAAPLAAANGWPLFLSSKDGLSTSTKTAMADVTDVLVLGGTAAVPSKVFTQLQKTFNSAERLSGGNRYETAVAIAEYGVEEAFMDWDGVGIATGQKFPDALAGGVLQGMRYSVMLLTRSESLPVATEDALLTHADEINSVTIYGGYGAVEEWVREHIMYLIN